MTSKRTPAPQHDTGSDVVLPRRIHLIPLDNIAGFDVRPGLYETNGAKSEAKRS